MKSIWYFEILRSDGEDVSQIMFFPRSIGQLSVNIINTILTKTFLKDIKKEALRKDQNQYITVRKCAH